MHLAKSGRQFGTCCCNLIHKQVLLATFIARIRHTERPRLSRPPERRNRSLTPSLRCVDESDWPPGNKARCVIMKNSQTSTNATMRTTDRCDLMIHYNALEGNKLTTIPQYSLQSKLGWCGVCKQKAPIPHLGSGQHAANLPGRQTLSWRPLVQRRYSFSPFYSVSTMKQCG